MEKFWPWLLWVFRGWVQIFMKLFIDSFDSITKSPIKTLKLVRVHFMVCNKKHNRVSLETTQIYWKKKQDKKKLLLWEIVGRLLISVIKLRALSTTFREYSCEMQLTLSFWWRSHFFLFCDINYQFSIISFI